MKGKTLGIRFNGSQLERLERKKAEDKYPDAKLGTWAKEILLLYSEGRLIKIKEEEKTMMDRIKNAIIDDEFREFWGLKDGGVR